jgi:hypothetical protein
MRDLRQLPADQPIGDKEYVGRRIAAKAALVGAWDQIRRRMPFDLRDFEESRPPHDISLDWIGKAGGPEKKVTADLGQLATKLLARQKPPRTFAGWVYLQVGKLSKAHKEIPCRVVASPDYPGQPDHEDHNPYHCLVKYEQTFGHPYLLAQHVYLQFVKSGSPLLYPGTPFYKAPYQYVVWLYGLMRPKRPKKRPRN